MEKCSGSEAGLYNAAFAGTLGLACLVMCSAWSAHIDDTDAQLYQTVARHLAQDHKWFDLRYTRGVYPHFREHLPFGLWPFALGIRLFGEGALQPIAGLFTLMTLGGVGWLGRRLGGFGAGEAAMLVLGLCESFSIYGGRPRLDPLLVLLSNAAAVPLLCGRGGCKSLLGSAALGALACFVKGPFGLVPMAAATMARWVLERSTRLLFFGVGACFCALVPVSVFLLGNRTWGDGSYWVGYVQQQVLASAAGARTDGSASLMFPFWTLLGRFWPGLPLVLLGAVAAIVSAANKNLRLLALFCAFGLAQLCLPGRKVWNHELTMYPGLGLLAGLGCASWIRRWLRVSSRLKIMVMALCCVDVGGLVFVITGGAQRLFPQPCVVFSEFSGPLAKLPMGKDIGVISNPTDWKMISELAAERDLSPWPFKSWTELSLQGPKNLQQVLVAGALLPKDVVNWVEENKSRGWILLQKRQAP